MSAEAPRGVLRAVPQMASLLRAAAVPAAAAADLGAPIGRAAALAAAGQVAQARPCTTSAAGADHAAAGQEAAAASSARPPCSTGSPSGSQQLLQQRRRSSLFASSGGGGGAGGARSLHTGTRSFASQPAYAYEDDHEDAADDHLDPLALGGGQQHAAAAAAAAVAHAYAGSSELRLQLAAVLPGQTEPELPPWEVVREQKYNRFSAYRRELHHMDQWLWSGHHGQIPFIGRSRFDPRTLHGPWMELSATQEDLERHVAALAAMPRPNLLEAAAAAAAVHEQQRQASYPKTLFDDPADLALFPDPDALITPKGARKRWRIPKDPAVAALEAAAAAEAARAAKTEAAVEAARAAEAEASGEEARPPGKRRLVDASGSLPAVLRAVSEALPGALRAKTLDKSVEASLRRALSRADPDARMRTRQEDGEKKAATLLLITAERAGPMTTFLSEGLGLQAKQLRRLLLRAPWLLGLDLEKEVRPAVECYSEMLDITTEQLARMVVLQPRCLVADVDEHLLPLMDYLQGLGFSQRHMRRMLTGNPMLAEGFSMSLLRTCVAFWLGKGMARHDLLAFLTQYPKVLSIPQTTIQLKYDWLRDHLGYSLEDHARNPILLTRSLTDNLGPRISYAMHRGLRVYRPTEDRPPKNTGGPNKASTTAKEITQIGLDTFLKRVRSDKAEFKAFKEQWLAETLPAWLTQRGSSLDYYHSMAWLEKHGV